MWLAQWWAGQGPGCREWKQNTVWGAGILQPETGLLGFRGEN